VTAVLAFPPITPVAPPLSDSDHGGPDKSGTVEGAKSMSSGAHIFRFSLTALFGAVLFAAFGTAAIRFATPLWAGLTMAPPSRRTRPDPAVGPDISDISREKNDGAVSLKVALFDLLAKTGFDEGASLGEEFQGLGFVQRLFCEHLDGNDAFDGNVVEMSMEKNASSVFVPNGVVGKSDFVNVHCRLL
jgi:hypothetical protein